VTRAVRFAFVLSATKLAIEFRKVAYSPHGAAEILHDLNLAVERGETLVLLGRSGSGKTTTLRLINRLLSPTAGDIVIEGRSTREWNVIRLRRMIGYVIQEVGLFPHFTVERNIAVLPRLEGWPAERIQARVNELLSLVGLDPSLLSRGRRSRPGSRSPYPADGRTLRSTRPADALRIAA
jgi:osmoprotectant transport system ATP-binding protein